MDPVSVSKWYMNASTLSCRFGCAGTPRLVAMSKGKTADNQLGTGVSGRQNTSTSLSAVTYRRLRLSTGCSLTVSSFLEAFTTLL